MGKFFGKIGYGIDREVSPGVWMTSIIERPYKGEISRRVQRNQTANDLNDNLNFSMQISIISDDYSSENFSSIRYVCYKGAKWRVTDVDFRHPRLYLSIGGVYNGEHGSQANG